MYPDVENGKVVMSAAKFCLVDHRFNQFGRLLVGTYTSTVCLNLRTKNSVSIFRTNHTCTRPAQKFLPFWD